MTLWYQLLQRSLVSQSSIMLWDMFRLTSDVLCLWNRGFTTRNQCEKWVECKLNKAFLQILPKFFIFLMIFQSYAAAPSGCSTLKNHQIWQKNEEKSCVTGFQPITYSVIKATLWKPESQILQTRFIINFLKTNISNIFSSHLYEELILILNTHIQLYHLVTCKIFLWAWNCPFRENPHSLPHIRANLFRGNFPILLQTFQYL